MNDQDSKGGDSLVSAKEPHQIKSEALFRSGEKEVWISHGDAYYRLQVTKSGKLILTK